MSVYEWLSSTDSWRDSKRRHQRNEFRRLFRWQRREAILQRLDNILKVIHDGEKTVEDYLDREHRLHNNSYDDAFQDAIQDFFGAKGYLDKQDREDIAQDAFLATWEAAAKYRGLRDPVAYFKKALGYALRDFIRERQKFALSPDFEQDDGSEHGVEYDTEPDPFLRPAGVPPAPHNSPQVFRLYLEQKFGEYDADFLFSLVKNENMSLTEACEEAGLSRRSGYRIRQRAAQKME